MADNERKKLVWTIKKGLHNLTAEEIFGLIQTIGLVDEPDAGTLDEEDEESCFDYLCAYMSSSSLLTLEDEGVSWLLYLKDKIEGIIESHSESPVTQQVSTEVRTVPPVLLHPLPTDRATASINTGSMLTEVTNVKTEAYGTHTQLAVANTDTHEPDMQRLLSSYEELYNKLCHFNVPLTTHTTGKQLPSPRDCTQPSMVNTVHSPQYLLHLDTGKQPTQSNRQSTDTLPYYLPHSNVEQMPSHMIITYLTTYLSLTRNSPSIQVKL